jgi:hypothetical protein
MIVVAATGMTIAMAAIMAMTTIMAAIVAPIAAVATIMAAIVAPIAAVATIMAAMPMEIMVAPVTVLVAIVPAPPMIAIPEYKVAVYVKAGSPDAVEVPVATPWNGHVVIAVPRARAIKVVIAGPARSPNPDRHINAGACRLGYCDTTAQHQRGGKHFGKHSHLASPQMVLILNASPGLQFRGPHLNMT